MRLGTEVTKEQQQPAPAPFEPETPERKRRWWVWGLLALVVVGGVLYWRSRSHGEEAPTYDTAAVERRRIASRVTATGTLSALVTVQVGSQVSGRIQEINVDYNSPVKKGQVIARIDPQLLESALERAKANLIAAQANVQKARVEADNSKKQAERSKALRERQFISQAELDTAESSALSAQAQVSAAEGALAQARAALNEAQVNLRYATIVSPTDGIVISRSVDVGQTVAASLQAPTLFTIAEDLRKMQVDTSVAEADVGKLSPGMRATFTVDAYPGERFEGTIRQIRNAPQTVQNVVTYDAVIDVANPELKLKPGMTANVTVISAQRDNALAVPNSALRFRPQGAQGGAGAAGGTGRGAWAGRGGGAGGGAAGAAGAAGAGNGAGAAPGGAGEAGGSAGAPGGGAAGWGANGQKTVWVLKGGKPAPVQLKTGLTDGSFTEVVEGELQEGAQVITGQTSGGQASTAGTPTNSFPGMGGPGMGGRGGGRRGF